MKSKDEEMEREEKRERYLFTETERKRDCRLFNDHLTNILTINRLTTC